MDSEPLEPPSLAPNRAPTYDELEIKYARMAEEIAKGEAYVQVQLEAARKDAEERLARTESLAMQIVEGARGKAIEEAEKIIDQAAQEARAAMARHGESVERDGGIQRLIEFPSELKQAGISILSYFSEVLKQKYPEEETAVRIEQFGTLVRMTVNGPSGWREIIERDLILYGTVVVGKANPSSILTNELDILRLENKLNLAKVELEFEKRVAVLAVSNANERIASLECQLDRLHGAITLSLSSRRDPKIDMAAFVNQYSSNELVSRALELLQSQLSKPPELLDRPAIEEAARTIKDRDASILRRFCEIASNTAADAAGKILTSWVDGMLK